MAEPAPTDLPSRLAALTGGLLALSGGGAPVRSAVVAIDWPGHGSATAAAGLARQDTGAPMRVGTQFHIASVGKPMTAALILQAVEEGRIGPGGLETPLIATGVLPPDIVRRLHRIDGVSHGERITLRHLLTHTSGLRDHQIDDGTTTSDGYGGRPAPNSLVGRRAADFKRHVEAIDAGLTPDPSLRTHMRWIPWDAARPDVADAGLINYYLNEGMAEHALWPPGTAFHYSDTAFMILALLAEHALGASYHQLLRTRIFDPLGMNDSFLDAADALDPAPWTGEVADVWAGTVPLMSYGLNLSNDWGGGGQVCTAADLNRFITGLLAGRLFQRPETLADMLRWQEPQGRPAHYTKVGCGIFTFTTPAGRSMIGHSGAWGAKMLHMPETGLTLSGTTNLRASPADWAVNLADALLDG